MLPVLILLLAGVTPIGLATQILGVPPHDIFFNSILLACIISWQSRKQSIVTLLSTKAEYIVVATAVKEWIWLQSIISKLKYTL